LRAEQRSRRQGLKNRDQAIPGSSLSYLNIGAMFGLDDVANMSRAPAFTLKPTIAWFGSFNNFDIYMGGFYTVYFDDPLMQNIGLQETFGYNFLLGDSTTLTVNLDNDDQFRIAPGEPTFMFAAVEPSVALTQDLTQGDISLRIGVPMDYAELVNTGIMGEELGKEQELYLDAYIILGYNAPFGLGVELKPIMNIVPEPQYSDTDLTVTYVIKSLYLSLTASADKDFKSFSLEPYIAWTIKNFIFSATVVFDNIGEAGTGNVVVDAETGADRITITPSVGVKYRF
jgi:hypothetical protein